MKTTTSERGLRAAEQAVARIHQDPSLEHSIAELARCCNLSPERFIAFFKQHIGESPGAYVRRARIEFAVKMLRATPDMTLTEAAFASGHSDLSALSRSFKAFYGMAPKEWDRRRILKNYKNCQASAVNNAYLWKSLPELPGSRRGAVSIRHYPAMHLALMRIAEPTIGDNLARGFDVLEAWAIEHGQIKDEFSFMGLSHADLFSSSPPTIDFTLGYPVAAGQPSSGPVVIRDFAPFTAAVIHCVGRVDDYIKAWDQLARDWLPNSAYVQTPMPAIEMYFSDPRPSRMAEWNMDCIIPVTRAHQRN